MPMPGVLSEGGVAATVESRRDRRAVVVLGARESGGGRRLSFAGTVVDRVGDVRWVGCGCTLPAFAKGEAAVELVGV